MPSATITGELKKYGIGAKLRQLRLRKSMGLLQLSKHTGISPALLSKLERDVLYPTLPTLTRIAMSFNVGLDHFFTPEPRQVFEIVRAKDRLSFPEFPDAAEVSYYFECLDFPVPNRALHCYLAKFTQHRSGLHEHRGIEFLYVLSGTVEVQVREERHELRKNDAVYFDSGTAHGYRAMGTRPATAIIVSLPSKA
jgi:transcriptional regulator with XRE-family HTH domain